MVIDRTVSGPPSVWTSLIQIETPTPPANGPIFFSGPRLFLGVADIATSFQGVKEQALRRSLQQTPQGSQRRTLGGYAQQEPGGLVLMSSGPMGANQHLLGK